MVTFESISYRYFFPLLRRAYEKVKIVQQKKTLLTEAGANKTHRGNFWVSTESSLDTERKSGLPQVSKVQGVCLTTAEFLATVSSTQFSKVTSEAWSYLWSPDWIHSEVSLILHKIYSRLVLCNGFMFLERWGLLTKEDIKCWSTFLLVINTLY